MAEVKHKVDFRATKRIIIFETASHFKMLSVALSGLVLVRNFF